MKPLRESKVILDSGFRRNDAGYLASVTKTYRWDVQDRLTSVAKDDQTVSDDDLLIEYEYCATCGGALSERIEYDNDSGGDVVSWLRYEYEGLNLLRIDEKYDSDEDDTLEETDAWRPLNVFVHAPGSIGQIVRSKWYNYRDCTTTPCDSGYYYYFYDALGNVAGVYDENTDEFIDYEMDAFGNDLPGGNSFLAMDQPGPKEHLTGKMYDTDTGLYYFHARWYDPGVGRFVSADKIFARILNEDNSAKGCGNLSYEDPRLLKRLILRNPQNLNRYAFCVNNPLSHTDVNGESTFIEDLFEQIGLFRHARKWNPMNLLSGFFTWKCAIQECAADVEAASNAANLYHSNPTNSDYRELYLEAQDEANRCLVGFGFRLNATIMSWFAGHYPRGE